LAKARIILLICFSVIAFEGTLSLQRFGVAEAEAQMLVHVEDRFADEVQKGVRADFFHRAIDRHRAAEASRDLDEHLSAGLVDFDHELSGGGTSPCSDRAIDPPIGFRIGAMPGKINPTLF
jgi:hypothetical protein